ncbi:hypothetical protein B9J90_07040 [Vibrio sp. V09_P4A23P171]|uniref:capsule biosynthesis GfcC family protein n=1 Tax=Vibrio sp. V09_P4A23P171 TaxID=1938664 RepID=UPI000B8E9BC9|nr:capsule biosynthesis GfcC family protein [Vibrio sp. V09_P4A23P171]OXX36943.1 hypothetical protein B9J90_07040 [Vibrio sp. V09_P4A23P171]
MILWPNLIRYVIRYVWLEKRTLLSASVPKATLIKPTLMKHFLLGVLCALSPAAYSAPASVVEVRSAEKPALSLSFASVPKVDELVINALNARAQLPADIDWLSSALFDVTSPYQKKQQVLLAITHQESLAASAHKKRWRQLKEQLRANTFAQRIFTPLDPDITRITASQNPKLQGQWLLSLNTLPTTVSVFGNVKQAGDMAWKPRTDAGHYVRSAGLAETDISQVWVIQPDGHASLHDIAYWNHDFQDIAPGATLYVPFPIETTSLYPQYSLHNVNDIVVELLRNQLP